jgi:serine/threonine protein kinase/HAMP domain-containing protein
VLSYLLAHRIVRPVHALAEAARRAAGGDFSAGVDVTTPDELGALAGAMRTMLADLREKHDLVEVLGDAHAPDAIATDAPTRDAAEPPTVIAGRYRLLRPLGAGGMGVVHLARDAALGETVAIKLLRPEVRLADPTAIERFKAEIRLARRITHRNVVRLFDLGSDDGHTFLTMEYVAGTSLADLLASHGRLPVRATVAIGAQLCRALAAAHAQGVVHRDVKPQNLLVRPDGVLKVLDFGVARAVRAAGGITLHGAAVGTPEYMAPEQLFGEEVDERADLYAAGAVLYECLTGRTPHGSGPPAVLATRVLAGRPPAIDTLRSDVPPALAALVRRALDRDRDARPRSATEMHALLEAV